VVTTAAALRFLPESRPDRAERVDRVGLLALTTGLGALLAPLVLGRSEGWPAWTFVSLAASLPLLAFFAWWELRQDAAGQSPMLRLSILRRRAVISGLIVTLGFFSFYQGLQFALTLFLQLGLGQDPLRVGLTWAPLSVTFAAAALIGHRATARYGALVLSVGSMFSILGVAVLLALIHAQGDDVGTVHVAAALSLIGIGNGLVAPSLLGTVLIGLPAAWSGATSGLLITAQQFAGAVGVAIAGALFYGTLATRGPVPAIESALIVVLALCTAAGLTTLLLPRRSRTVGTSTLAELP
jgi:hypothetical protein